MSLLFDKKCCHWNEVDDQHHVDQPSTHNAPAHDVLQTTMTGFKEMQFLSEAEAKEIEQGTRDQRQCSLLVEIRLQLQILEENCLLREKHHLIVWFYISYNLNIFQHYLYSME